MNQKDLVDIITREVISKFDSTRKNKDKSVRKNKMLVLVNELLGVKKFTENLLTMEESDNWDFSFIFIDEKVSSKKLLYLEDHIDVVSDKSHIKSVIGNFDAVLITDLNISQLSSSAALIGADEVSSLIIDCIFNNRLIYIGGENFDPVKLTSVPFPVRDAILQNIRTLNSYNINFVQLDDMPGILRRLSGVKISLSAKKKIIIKDDISEGFQKGLKELILYPGDIITPLARDEAKKYGIEITERQ
ncbi:MAG: hypothetical protein ABIH00_07395 [Armatimonadota bacterium]